MNLKGNIPNNECLKSSLAGFIKRNAVWYDSLHNIILRMQQVKVILHSLDVMQIKYNISWPFYFVPWCPLI